MLLTRVGGADTLDECWDTRNYVIFLFIYYFSEWSDLNGPETIFCREAFVCFCCFVLLYFALARPALPKCPYRCCRLIFNDTKKFCVFCWLMSRRAIDVKEGCYGKWCSRLSVAALPSPVRQSQSLSRSLCKQVQVCEGCEILGANMKPKLF